MAVVLFDGVCNLCDAVVRFVITRDPAGTFQFAPLGSDAARRLLPDGSLEQAGDSVLLVDDGRVYSRSDAALRIARRLTFPWPLAYGFILVPRAVRDAIYDSIARRRYRWFGRREACALPDPSTGARFLSD